MKIDMKCEKCGEWTHTKLMTLYWATDKDGIFYIDLQELKQSKRYELFCFLCDELVGKDF